ncbi:hypothetical protein [Paraburkholderia franconis]|uniref:hypothetical protein n=1 Tax=Paraburkholderia franconis TaxID=2654983 RepID=UPI003898FF0B
MNVTRREPEGGIPLPWLLQEFKVQGKPGRMQKGTVASRRVGRSQGHPAGALAGAVRDAERVFAIAARGGIDDDGFGCIHRVLALRLTVT